MSVWAAVTLVFLVRVFAGGMLAPGAAGPPPALGIRIDLNRAKVPELMALPGVGRTRAEAIVLHRVRHGPFRSVGDLERIDGIGPATAAAIAPHATVGSATAGLQRR